MPSATLNIGPFDQYDSQVLELTVKEGDPLAVRNITSDRIIFAIQGTTVNKDTQVGSAEVEKVDAANGRADIKLLAGDLSQAPGAYNYEVVLISATTRSTILQGVLHIDKSIIVTV